MTPAITQFISDPAVTRWIAARTVSPLSQCAPPVYAKENAMRRSEQTNWTTERVQMLKELYPIMSSQKVADRMGLSKNAVIGKANRLGMKFTKGVTYKGTLGDVAVARLMADEKPFIKDWKRYGFTSPSQAALMQQKIIDDMGEQAI